MIRKHYEWLFLLRTLHCQLCNIVNSKRARTYERTYRKKGWRTPTTKRREAQQRGGWRCFNQCWKPMEHVVGWMRSFTMIEVHPKKIRLLSPPHKIKRGIQRGQTIERGWCYTQFVRARKHYAQPCRARVTYSPFSRRPARTPRWLSFFFSQNVMIPLMANKHILSKYCQ